MNAILNTSAEASGFSGAGAADAASDGQTPQPSGTPDYSSRLSDGQANSVYAAAYNLSQQGKHEHASTLFALLTMYRPQDPKYTRSVAICFRKMGRYEDAIRYFAKTMELGPQDYEPAFQLVECMLLIGRLEEAVDLLEKFAAMAAATGQEGILEQASGMLELLNPASAEAVVAETDSEETAS